MMVPAAICLDRSSPGSIRINGIGERDSPRLSPRLRFPACRYQNAMTRPDDITVVIAAKDEARTIGSLVTRSFRHASDVVVVDGHSTDGTAAVAAAAGARILVDRGRGKGDALRLAIDAVTTDIIVFLDGDGSHEPDDIPGLVAPILAGHADHVSGSRLMGGSSELHGGFDEFFRLTGSSLITACINWRFGVRLSESQNGFRAIRTEVARRLDLRENATTIEQEMIIKTLRLGFRMAEVPAHEFRRSYGISHIRLWRAAPRYAVSLLWHLFPPRVPTAVASVPARRSSSQMTRRARLFARRWVRTSPPG
jgi:glycosyltransferase involved in cell wall biosynthesis